MTSEKPDAGETSTGDVTPPPASPPGGIGLVAIDLDGTLLNDSKKVSTRTAGALKGLPDRGVKVVIASARPPRSVRHIYHALHLDTWQINYNGALIWDEPGQRAVFHQPMDCALVRKAIDHARDLFPDVLVSCEIMDRWFTDRDEQAYKTETGRLFRPNLVAPLDDFCIEPVTKLLLLGPPETIDTLKTLFRAAYPTLSVVYSDPELLQVMHHQASKAAALLRVADHYGVPMQRVMAIGDAVNDVPMLTVAGVAIAMDNAHPAVKQIAHWVAPSNNDHGVHAALVKYGLC
jgi:Cof subfamily protein (haloacid dehalogenase superfamily)